MKVGYHTSGSKKRKCDNIFQCEKVNEDTMTQQQQRKAKLIPVKQHDSRYSQFNSLFAKYDHDGSGLLTKAEFQAGFQEYGLEWSQELENEFEGWDTSGDGQVSIAGKSNSKAHLPNSPNLYIPKLTSLNSKAHFT